MRKIIVGAQVSMDGVMQAPGTPTEDPSGEVDTSWAGTVLWPDRRPLRARG